MSEEEVINILTNFLTLEDKWRNRFNKGTVPEAIDTVLQLLEQKDKRIDELEKALVEEAIKSKVLELYNQRINKLKDKLKKDIKNNKSGINLMDLRCIGKWQEAKEILKILEE